MPTSMNPTQQLHESGQSIWLDNITRNLFTSGRLKRAIDELSLTGLTSNPTIFHNAISKSSDYDAAVRRRGQTGQSVEDLFFDLALEDISAAADLFRPITRRPRASTAGFRSKSHRSSRMTRQARSKRPSHFRRERASRMY